MKSILMLLWGKRKGKVTPAVRTETEGVQARESAVHALQETKAQTTYYKSLSNDLRLLRERNHFADNIRATIKGA